MPTSTIHGGGSAPTQEAARQPPGTAQGVKPFPVQNEQSEDSNRNTKTSILEETDNPKTETQRIVNTETDIIGDNEDADAGMLEATIDEELVAEFKVNCNEGMRLLKILKYPSTARHDEQSSILSHVLVKERDSKRIRVGAIVVNDAAVKGKGKITRWDVLDKCPEYKRALLSALENSSPNSVHAFHATLRYPNDFVLAVVASPNDDRIPDGAHVDGKTDENLLKYNIVVRRIKHHQTGVRTIQKNLFSRWFKRSNSKSISEGRSQTSSEPVSHRIEIKKSEIRPPSNGNKKPTPNEYVPLGGIDDSQRPIQTSAQHTKDVGLDSEKRVHFDFQDGQQSSAFNEAQPTHRRRKRALTECQIIAPNSTNFALKAVLQIGSICGLSVGITYLLVKKSKLAA